MKVSCGRMKPETRRHIHGGDKMFELIKKYQKDQQLRDSFNALAEKTFGLNFEGWYQTGYWRDNYIPYSIVMDGKIVANVSVNITDMLWQGQRKSMIQLGTVMTDEAYRNQGLIREIMKEIEADFGEKTDGMYLFANDSVLDFYPKFGFEKAVEYQYTKHLSAAGTDEMEQIQMKDAKNWAMLEAVMEQNRFQGTFDMVDNIGLFMFYVTQFMQESVYYCKRLETYVIAEQEGDELFVHNVFSKQEVSLAEVLNTFGADVKKVRLGFVPQEKEGFEAELVQEEDTTLFVKGNVFAEFEKEGLMFPTLAHA